MKFTVSRKNCCFIISIVFIVIFIYLLYNYKIIEMFSNTTATATTNFTSCTQVNQQPSPNNTCEACKNAYIINAGNICKWDPVEKCNSFDGSRICPK